MIATIAIIIIISFNIKAAHLSQKQTTTLSERLQTTSMEEKSEKIQNMLDGIQRKIQLTQEQINLETSKYRLLVVQQLNALNHQIFEEIQVNILYYSKQILV